MHSGGCGDGWHVHVRKHATGGQSNGQAASSAIPVSTKCVRVHAPFMIYALVCRTQVRAYASPPPFLRGEAGAAARGDGRPPATAAASSTNTYAKGRS